MHRTCSCEPLQWRWVLGAEYGPTGTRKMTEISTVSVQAAYAAYATVSYQHLHWPSPVRASLGMRSLLNSLTWAPVVPESISRFRTGGMYPDHSTQTQQSAQAAPWARVLLHDAEQQVWCRNGWSCTTGPHLSHGLELGCCAKLSCSMLSRYVPWRCIVSCISRVEIADMVASYSVYSVMQARCLCRG